jgi:type I restriction enzyme S subunit
MNKNNNNNIPKRWRRMRIKDIGKVITGKTPSTFDPLNFGGPYPFITIPDLKNQRYIEKTERTLSEKGGRLMKGLKLPPKAVMVSCLATVGEIGITVKESFTNQQINSVICDESKVVPEFLYYYFKYSKPKLLKYSGSVYVNISKSKFENFEVVIPEDINEQKRIADILSAFDDKIELNNKIINTLEEMAQAIFKEWFIKFRFPGWEKVKFVDSELGRTPEGWEIGYLGDGVCSEIIKPGIERFNGEKIYLATADVVDTEIVNSSTKIAYENRPIRANSQPVLNSIWFAKMINTYKVLFFFEGNKEDIEKYILSTGFMGIKALRNMQYYLYLFINSKNFHQIKDTLVQGAVQEAITNTNVKEIKVLIPPENLINKFNEEIEPLIIKIYKSKVENQKLSALRDLLLPKLMSPPREINI